MRSVPVSARSRAGGIDHANIMFPYKFEAVGVRALKQIAASL